MKGKKAKISGADSVSRTCSKNLNQLRTSLGSFRKHVTGYAAAAHLPNVGNVSVENREKQLNQVF